MSKMSLKTNDTLYNLLYDNANTRKYSLDTVKSPVFTCSKLFKDELIDEKITNLPPQITVKEMKKVRFNFNGKIRTPKDDLTPYIKPIEKESVKNSPLMCFTLPNFDDLSP